MKNMFAFVFIPVIFADICENYEAKVLHLIPIGT